MHDKQQRDFIVMRKKVTKLEQLQNDLTVQKEAVAKKKMRIASLKETLKPKDYFKEQWELSKKFAADLQEQIGEPKLKSDASVSIQTELKENCSQKID